ncbi:hypothetical protein [Chloroflexus sp.]|uniref:hypothetical protein n=1 Tax=Chloroflexus sp. TaxID=1904827 RepID=UPI00404ABDE0
MLEPSGHCPYLGLKQNQAIRFASPTPEHRCYASGQAQEIPRVEPDYQVRYCLSTDHVRCPLYMGMPLPTTSAPEVVPAGVPSIMVSSPPSPSPGLRAWLSDLTPRDRLIYTVLLSVLVIALIGYALGGVAFLSTLFTPAASPSEVVPASATPTAPLISPTIAASGDSTATPSPTLTASPTLTPSPTATPYELIPVTNTPTVPIFIPPPPPPPPPTPTETPLPEVPGELPTEVPPETPTEVPPETPTEVLPETPTESPPASTETPPETPTEVPPEVPTEAPPVVPTEIPTPEVVIEASPTFEPQRTATP